MDEPPYFLFLNAPNGYFPVSEKITDRSSVILFIFCHPVDVHNSRNKKAGTKYACIQSYSTKHSILHCCMNMRFICLLENHHIL